MLSGNVVQLLSDMCFNNTSSKVQCAQITTNPVWSAVFTIQNLHRTKDKMWIVLPKKKQSKTKQKTAQCHCIPMT